MPKIHSLYDLPAVPGVTFVQPSMTQQQFKEEADINNIIARYQKTGFFYDPLSNPGTSQPQFGDFTAVADFHSAQTLIAQASEAFADLPSNIRKRFNNNPAELLSFLEDENNREEGVKLGLIRETTTVEPVTVVIPETGS